MTIELCNIVRSRLDDVMKKTIRLKTLELDNVILNTTKKADQALEYFNMETTLPLPFVNNPVLKVMKKKVLVKREAEQVLEYLNMEMAVTLHSVDTKVVKVKEKDVVEASTTYGILQDFNWTDDYNSLPVTVQVTHKQDVFEPGNKEIGLPIGLSWILLLFCAIHRELPQPKEL